jgi:hypothetical protein
VSAAAKLAGFAAALLAVCGAAAVAGAAIGPVHDPGRSPDEPRAGMAGMDGAGEHAAPVRGLAVAEDGLTLQLARTTARPGRPFDLRFRVAGRDGRTVRDFDIEHTKRMHLIVVRRDLSGFQHLHPAQAADGTWTVPVTLEDPGSYRVFADFSVDGTAHTLAGDLQLDGAVRSRPLPPPATGTSVDGMQVTLREGRPRAGAESSLRFAVTRRGRPVAVQDYLGAKGHLVALRQGDLAFLHVHPDEDSLRFTAEFPTAGTYRLFLQFRVGGRVHTAEFTVEVAR